MAPHNAVENKFGPDRRDLRTLKKYSEKEIAVEIKVEDGVDANVLADKIIGEFEKKYNIKKERK